MAEPDQQLAELLNRKSSKKYAQFKALYPTVEQKISEGFTHAEIHAAIVQTGLMVSLKLFQLYLYRARKAAKKGKMPAPQLPKEEQQKTQVPAKPATITPKKEGTGKPTNFDWEALKNEEIKW